MALIDLAALVTLGAIWGSSFLFIRLAVPVLGPPALMDMRVFLAAGVLLLYPLLRHRPLVGIPRLPALLLLGAINAAIPFTLIAFSELRLPAALAAILNATTPLFAALVAALWIGQPLARRAALGLVTGMMGVALVVGWSPIHLSGPVLLAVAASLLAAFFYAVGGVFTRVGFQGVPTMTLAIMQQAAAGTVLLPFALIHPPLHSPSLTVALAVVTLAVQCTAIGYLLYFFLMARVGPTSTLTVTFLVPLFGLLWSALFLGERIGPGTIVGLAVILASLALVNGLDLRLLLGRLTRSGGSQK